MCNESCQATSRDSHGTRVSDLIQFKKTRDCLRKIKSLPDSIDILLDAAASPGYRYLLKYNLILTPLKSKKSKASRVPRTSEDWERVLEGALGRTSWHEYDGLCLDLKVVERDTAYMAEDSLIKADLVVHCETKLLQGLERI